MSSTPKPRTGRPDNDRGRAGLVRPSDVVLRRPVVAGLLAASAISLAVMAAVAHQKLLVVDQPITDAVRDPGLVRLFDGLSELGSPNTAILLSIVLGVVLWPRCRAFALAFPATVLTGVAAELATKAIVGRPRPPEPEVSTLLGSFPSGHVVAATVFYGLLIPALYLLTRQPWVHRLALLAYVPLVAIVAWSRIGLGAHWLTDTLGSVLLGGALLLLAELAVATPRAHRLCRGCELHVPHSVQAVREEHAEDLERR